MNRVTLFADISGQRSRTIEGNPRITAVAVALPTADIDEIRTLLPLNLSKWKYLQESAAREVIALLASRAVIVAGATVNRDNDAWRKALADEEILHSEVASESRQNAGWIKLPTVLAYQLLSRACLLALVHFLRQTKAAAVLNSRGLIEVECEIICDQEFSGEESVDTFKSLWNDENIPTERLASFGFQLRHPAVVLATEQEEPLLLLADISAGLIHSAHIPNPGRVKMPLSSSLSKEILRPLQARQKLAIDEFQFDMDYDQVFGSAMEDARAQHFKRKR